MNTKITKTETDTTTAIDMSALSGVPKAAAELAVIAAKDAELMDTVHELSEGNVMQKRKGLIVALSLGEAYGDEGLDRFPVPGTETGNNPDRYTVPGKNAKGVATNKKRSFYRDFAEFTPEGMALKAQHKTVMDDASIGDKEKETKLAGINTRLDYLASVYAGAVAFIVQMKVINEMFADKVEAIIQNEIPGDEDSGPSNSTKPILLIDLVNRGESKVMSVGAFVALKPKAAEGKGFKELIATSSRKGKEGSAATSTPVPASAEKVADVALALLNAFTDKATYGKLSKGVIGEGGDILIEALGDLHGALDGFMPVIQQAYDRMQAAKATKKLAEKAAA